MKSFFAVLALAAVTLPMTVACSHTVAENDKTSRNWNGTVSQDDTKVKKNDVTGTTTVEHEKSQY